ncbi:MAG TPA: hypothetical protein VFU30_06875 [Gaiellaceae bacterium]|nr:hypothetical protein [Gaiellaceae bacterium]
MASAGLEQRGVPPADLATSQSDRDAAREAPAVLRIIWADPQHTAEHLALWALRRFGPRAEAALTGLRALDPPPGRDELERQVVQRQTRVATTEGAFVGGPFIFLIPVAFCAALLSQGQMVFELAGVAGHDPTERTRAAELLVLQGAYASTAEAAAALEALPEPGIRAGGRLPAGTRVDTVKHLAYLIGLFGPPDLKRSKLRATVGWTGIGILVLVGLVIPLVWLPYMAFSTRRATLRLAKRTRAFYATPAPADAVVSSGEGQVATGGLVAFARMVVLCVFPFVVGFVWLVTGFSFAGGHWLTSAVVLLAASALTTLGWLGYRRWRRGAQR